MIQLEEAAKLCWTEHTAQKTRKEVKVKVKEEAKKKRVVEKKKKKKKKKILEYLQQLQDEMLEEEAILLEGAKGSKYKKIVARDKEGQ